MADQVNGINNTQNAVPAQGTSVPKPSMPSAPSTPAAQENVFTELFGKQGNGLENSQVMKAVSGQQEKKSSFFGAKPKLDAIEKPNAHPEKAIRSVGAGNSILQVSLLLMVLMGAFFYTQNSMRFQWFGSLNPAQEEAFIQEQVGKLQAEILVQNHLSAILLLDQFSSLADAYLYNLAQSESNFNSQNKRTEFAELAASQKPELGIVLGEIQENLNYFKGEKDVNLARSVADDWINEIKKRDGEVDSQSLLQDVQDLESTKTLLSSSDFTSALLVLNPEQLSDEDIQKIHARYSTISRSVETLLTQIKTKRVDWNFYLEELERLTKEVDPLFNTEFESNLRIGDVRLNADGTLAISGSTATNDSKNFSLIADLMDSYEESDHFKNVAERNFSKTAVDQEYTGNFQISLELEFPDPNAQ